jgi:hypothetical protein
LIDGTKKWTDVLNDALHMLLRMMLQAMLLGQGPFGGLFGGTGKAGGIIGLLLGGLGGLAEGGPVRGPGTGKSDSIVARLSDGEYVVNAESTRKHRRLIEAINNDKLPADMARKRIAAFSEGGFVGRVPDVPAIPTPSLPRFSVEGGIVSAPTVNTTNHFSINVQGSAGTPAQNKDLADKIGRAVGEHLDQRMTAVIVNQMRPGGLLGNVVKRG